MVKNYAFTRKGNTRALKIKFIKPILLLLFVCNLGFFSVNSLFAQSTTPPQTINYNFVSPNSETIALNFDGFDASLGTLTSVNVEWTLDASLDNTTFNISAVDENVGIPNALVANSVTTFTVPFSADLNDANTLSTPPFVGSVIPGFSVVSTITDNAITGTDSICTDGSCTGTMVADLNSFIGGLGIVNISVFNSTNQSGSVPATVFSGNTAIVSGSYTIVYGYTPNPGPCSEIIPPGNPTNRLFLGADYTIDNTGSGPGGAVIMNAIIVGGTSFSNLIAADNVSYQFANQSATNQLVLDQGVTIANITQGAGIFDPALLAAMADRDLNHYLKLDTGITNTDYVDFLYNTPVTSAGNRYFITTERGFNNSTGIQALDINGNLIGTEVLINSGAGYDPTGLFNDNGQQIGSAVYPLTALVPRTTLIYGLRYRQNGTGDGADGKVFILRDPLTSGCLIVAEDDDFSGTTIMSGNSTSSVFLDNGNGVDDADGSAATNANISNNISITNNGGIVGITINSDGTINIPLGTPTNFYTIEYQICLEIEDTICDTASVIINVLESPCDELIPLGNPTAQIPSADITWDFTGTGPAGNIILNGITIAGEPNQFTNLITPDNVIVSVQNLNTSKKISLNGAILSDGDDGIVTFSNFVLAEAQDRNLNHYLKFDANSGGTVQGDHVDYLYNDPIISAKNRYILATERGGNNSSSTQALDINGNPIGVKALNNAGSNYFLTGATHENGQAVRATVYPLTALVPRGTLIYGIRYLQEDNGDGADGQAFIMRDPVTIGCTITAEDDDFTGSLINGTTGGTTPSVFADNGNGTDDANGVNATNANIDDNITLTNLGGLPVGTTIDSNGVITIPVGANPGTFTVTYQICLDLDNTICDTATAKITII